jgi:hypothetical protein
MLFSRFGRWLDRPAPRKPKAKRANQHKLAVENLEDRQLLSGLAAAYSFDQGAGPTLNDISGNGNTGTITNATWTSSGKYGGALQFTGVSGSWATVNDSSSLDLTKGMTLEAWVNPTTLNSPDNGWVAAIAKQHVNSSNDISYALYAANGTGTGPAVHILVGSTDYGAQGGSQIPLNSWTFLAGTYDGTTLKMYVNGVLVGSQTISGKIATTTDALRIGGDWSGEMFTGSIDNVRIYYQALTANQIKSDMNAAVGPVVTSVTPVSGATNVLPGTSITVAFSEALKASSVGSGTIYLKDSSNNLVAATVTYNTKTNTATLTPTAPLANSMTYTATVLGGSKGITDPAGNPMTANYVWTFTTDAPSSSLTVNPSTLPSATANSAYSATVSATGGSGSYTFALTKGALPSWLTLNTTTGALSGTPTTTGTASFTIMATDSKTASLTGSQAYTLTINAAGSLTVSPASLASATANSAYSTTVSASGGSGTYTFAVTSGSLPSWLSLNTTTGVLSGTPTSTGTFSFTITATDGNTATLTGSKAYTLTVNAAASLTLSPTTLSSATANSAYSAALTATGGSGTYTFAMTAGSLPAGLSLNGTTGVLSGTPTASGTSSFTVTATDTKTSSLTGSQAYTLTINAANNTTFPNNLSVPPLPAPTGTIVNVSTVSQLENAVANLQSGQTIMIAAGTYNLTAGLYIGLNGQVTNVAIRGATGNPADVVLLGAGMDNSSIGMGISVWNAQSVTIANLSIGDVYYDAIELKGDQGADRITIYNCHLYDSGEQLIKSDPNSTGGGVTNSVVEYCTIDYTTAPSTVDHGGGSGYTNGVDVHGGSTWIVSNNLFENFHTPDSSANLWNPVVLFWNHSVNNTVNANTFINCDRAIAFGLDELTSGYDNQGGIIENNFVYMAAGEYSASRIAGADAPIIAWDSPGTLIANNTILTNGNMPNSIQLRFVETANVTIDNNLSDAPVRARDSATYTASDNYFSATASMFVNPAIGDLHLISNSATQANVIGKGVFLASIPTDYDGQTRTSPTDIGADQYSATTSNLTVSPSTLTSATANSAYSATLSATGGSGSYTFAVTSGSLPSWLSLNGTTGTLTGTPTSTGSYTFTITATDTKTSGLTGSMAYTLTVNAASSLTLSPATLATATANTAYSATFSATGGSGTCTFVVSVGSLPSWLTLNTTTGALSGTPTTTGTYTFTIKATDSKTSSLTGTLAYTLTVNAASSLAVSPTSLAAATVNTAYSATVSATGGSGSYTFAVSSGSLPSWLTLNSTTGVLSGTPTATGTWTFTIKATDGNSSSLSGSAAYTLTASAATNLTITPPTLANATANSAYTATVSASGGSGTCTFSVSSGSLPSWLSLNTTTGALSGTPTTTSTSSFTIKATDSKTSTLTGSQAYTLTVNAAGNLTVSPSTLPSATANAAYTATLTATGGAGTYTFAVSTGSLPSWLTLNGSTGVLSGTPTTTGSSTFTITATDAKTSSLTGSLAFTLTVNAAARLTVAPATLPSATVNSAYSATLSATGGSGSYTFAVTSGSLPSWLTLNTTTGALSGTPSLSGTSSFTITATDSKTGSLTGSQAYTLTVNSAVPPVTSPTITTNYLTIPNFGAKPTIYSVANDDWSSPSTWSLGRVPTTGDIVDIWPGTTVTYDVNSSVALNTLEIQPTGILTFRTDISTELVVGNFLVLQGGTLAVGTAINPIASNVNVNILIANQAINTATDPSQFGTGLIVMGNVTMHGATKTPYATLSQEAHAGDTVLHLASPVTGWQAGDDPVLPDTRQITGDGATNYTYQPEWERVTIQSVSADGLTVYLSAPLKYDHLGARDANGVLDYLPQVMNDSRNIMVASQSFTGTRGYTLYTGAANVDIEYAGFCELGRSTGSNQADRYAMTMLDLIGPATPQANGYQFTLIGDEVDNDGDGNSKNPSNIQWGIAVSNSYYGLIQSNDVWAVAGVGIGVEDASASYNRFDSNFVGNVTGSSNRYDQQLQGDGFWFHNPNNYVTNNIATDINGGSWDVFSYGFVIDASTGTAGGGVGTVSVAAVQGDDPSVPGQSKQLNMNDTPILQFSGNEIYGATQSGMTLWWIGTYGDTFYSDAQVSVVKNFVAWNFSTRGFYGYPTNNVTIDGMVVRGDESQLSNQYNYVTGINFDDYMTRNLIIQNSNIQGMATGIEAPFMVGRVSAMDTTLIQNCYFNNTVNIDLTPPRSVNGSDGLSPMTLNITSDQFAHSSAAPSAWWYDVSMSYVTSDSLGTSNFSIPQYVYVYNYNNVQGDNFDVFYTQNSPTKTTQQYINGYVQAF